MPKIRTVKPQFWEDDKVGELSFGARLLLLCSFNLADDDGRLRWNDAYLGSQAFMYDGLDSVTTGNFRSELEKSGFVVTYVVRGTTYAEIVNFAKHQAISHRTPSKLPAQSEGQPAVQKNPVRDRKKPETTGNFRKEEEVEEEEEVDSPSGSVRAQRASAPAREGAPSAAVALPAGRLPATTEKAPAKVGASITAADIVAAWIDTQTENGVIPADRQKGQVAKEAKELLTKGNDPDKVLKAAIDAGTKGFHQLGFELSAMSGRSVPRSIASKPTRDDKVRALRDRAIQERAKENAAKAANNG